MLNVIQPLLGFILNVYFLKNDLTLTLTNDQRSKCHLKCHKDDFNHIKTRQTMYHRRPSIDEHFQITCHVNVNNMECDDNQEKYNNSDLHYLCDSNIKNN